MLIVRKEERKTCAAKLIFKNTFQKSFEIKRDECSKSYLITFQNSSEMQHKESKHSRKIRGFIIYLVMTLGLPSNIDVV